MSDKSWTEQLIRNQHYLFKFEVIKSVKNKYSNGIKIKNPEGLDNAGLDDLKDDLYIQKKKGIKKRFTLTSTRSGSVHVPNLLK